MMNKKGFTLLEIIIVIIIIGVLTSLALPRLFAVIEGSRAAEAITAMASIKASMERGYLMNDGKWDGKMWLSSISSINALDIDDPADSPNAHFNYYVRSYDGFFGPQYFIQATRNTLEGGDIYQFIAMTYNIGASFITTERVDVGQDGSQEFDWGATSVYRGFVPK